MYEENVGKALKTILQKIEELNEKPNTVKRICSNCKFRRSKRDYDQELGYSLIIENWCAKDTNLMHTFYTHGNSKYFLEECEYFEQKRA